jgi:hypothetical protein
MSLLRAPRSHYELVLKSISLFYTMMVNRLNSVLRASNEHSFIVRVLRAKRMVRRLPIPSIRTTS